MNMMTEIERLKKEDIFKELCQIIGARVIKIVPYLECGWREYGYKIYFDNGMILTANDGEYGDNALQFIQE